MKKSYLPAGIVMALLFAAVAAPASADMTYWTDWTSQNGNVVNGTIAIGSNLVNVTYTGEVSFAQTSGGTDYWAPYNSTYTKAGIVDNGPASSDIISLTGGNATINTITFSQAVVNPVMAIMSMGQYGVAVQYDFAQPLDVLNYGRGYWGDGTLSEQAGDVLLGYEGHGIIQFLGTYSSISFTCPTYENWHGFTVGTNSLGNPAVPAPGAIALGMFGLSLVGWVKRRMA